GPRALVLLHWCAAHAGVLPHLPLPVFAHDLREQRRLPDRVVHRTVRWVARDDLGRADPGRVRKRDRRWRAVPPRRDARAPLLGSWPAAPQPPGTTRVAAGAGPA